MGKELCDAHPVARKTYEEADAILGFSISDVSFNGPEERLRETRNTQPAIFVHSVAAFRVLTQSGVRPTVAAGHSLGEYSALVAAGALGFDDGLALVQKRGELMHRAGLERPGTMAAVLGLPPGALEEVLGEASQKGIVLAANLNSPTQLVVSGETPAVEECMRLAREKGAARAVRLPVGGGFHSPLMESASRGLEEVLKSVDVRQAGFPVVANYTAVEETEPVDIKQNLARQVLGAVRWEESMRRMLSAGVKQFVEVGPGNVLKGLMRSIDRQASVASAGSPADVAAAVALFTQPSSGGR
ncbi:MAG: ACP S-malonyltransferase [Candidatus Eisenbacteria bacterium]|nr:ACP S-malonyltransferase [Candidatus Eisenbacteria bacterium]